MEIEYYNNDIKEIVNSFFEATLNNASSIKDTFYNAMYKGENITITIHQNEEVDLSFVQLLFSLSIDASCLNKTFTFINYSDDLNRILSQFNSTIQNPQELNV